MRKLLLALLLLAALLVRRDSALSGPPVLASGAVVDAAAYQRDVAPGMIVSVFGAGFSDTTVAAASAPLPTELGGVALELDDGAVTRDAPLFYVSPTQINAQIPYLDAGASLAVRVRNAAGFSDVDRITLVDAAPRLFTVSADGTGEPLLFHPDYTRVSDAAPAQAGETLVLFLTGLGSVAPAVPAGTPAGDGLSAPLNLASAPVSVSVSDQQADVAYAGLAPGYAGLYQLNFTIPAAVDSGRYDLAVLAGAQTSQTNISLPVVNRATAREYYAAPSGDRSGDGSRDRPWDLATALSPPAAVKPGDTIWLRGGTYGDGSTIFNSYLSGTPRSQITVRQAPGERATINGGLAIYGPYTWYWGFEVTNASEDRGAGRNVPECVDTYDGSTGVKLINLVLHDCNQGIGLWSPAENSEAFGNLIYNNGYQGTDRGHGHGIYTQNQNGTKLISDNIIFNQFGLGIQAYGSNKAFVEGYNVLGNIIFNNGSISAGANNVDNILFALGQPIQHIRIEDNYTYQTPGGNKGYSRVGWELSPAINQDASVRRNYWIGGQSAVELWNWTQLTFTGNTCYSADALTTVLTVPAGQSPGAYTWDGNTYYGSGKFRFAGQNQGWDNWRTLTGLDARSTLAAGRPNGAWTFVRPNKYELGRANIAIYNWDLQDTVPVDVSAILKPGDSYELRDAENFFAPPVLSGTWDGKPLAVPMAGLTVAAPIGNVPAPPHHTAPEFGAFVLIGKLR